MQMVREARRFLFLTTYYFGRDDRSGLMADELVAAARRGVQVFLVVDRFGHQLAANLSTAEQRPVLDARLWALEDAGGHVVRYAPRHLAQRLFGGGLHVKIQVSEAGVALFGSSNIDHCSFERWNEVSLELEGEVVRGLLEEACAFSGLGAEATAGFVAELPAADASAAPLSLRYVQEDPDSRAPALWPLQGLDNRLTNALVAFIDSAGRTLALTSFYFRPPRAIVDAILRACRRGVRVEIFHSHRDSLGVTYLPWIHASLEYRALLAAGARVYESRPGEHSKVLLKDDREVCVGSYNLEQAAHDRLIEAMMFTEEPSIVERFTALFSELRRGPQQIVLDASWLTELSFALRARRWLYRPFVRWM